jgi:aspartyl-tRNA(Asn)/glutamyl-tRNA(Gln) amidotransferase subunit A
MTFDQLADDLAQGRTTSAALVETAISKARSAPYVFLTLMESESRTAAAASDARRAIGKPLGPLDGIPIAWKDLVDIAGTRTTAGSMIRAGEPLATSDAPVVAATKALGLIPLGKTHLNEFAFSGIGYNPHFGTPYASRKGGEDRAPGGSSAGSAIAVERGIVAAAVGSDTGGSVRIPSAFNGLTGFKASQSRYDMTGVFPLAKSLDSLGPLATTVRDCVWMDAAMRGIAQPVVPASKPATIVFDETILDEPDVEDAVRRNTLTFVDRLRDAGITIERRKMKAFDAARATMRDIGWLGGYEAYEQHRETVAAHGDRMDPRVVARLGSGANFPAENLAKLRAIRKELIPEAIRELGDTILISPTVKTVAPRLPPLLTDVGTFAKANLLVLSLTMPGNFLDTPGVAMPSGSDADGHPTSVLLSAGNGRDDAMLSAALWVEKNV